MHFRRLLGFAGLACFKAPFRSRDLFAKPRGLDEEVVHRVAVVAIGFSACKAAFQLRTKVLRPLLQMFEISTIDSVLRPARHNVCNLELAAPPHFQRAGAIIPSVAQKRGSKCTASIQSGAACNKWGIHISEPLR